MMSLSTISNAGPWTAALSLLCAIGIVPVCQASEQDEVVLHQAQATLPRMLEITWKRGPNLPRGFQDSDGGILHQMLITVGGFCSGQRDVAGKKDVYPRGFLSNVWGLNLASPQAGWQTLPNLPGPARQELSAIVVSNRLYLWGGFSYSAPYCYKDGYRLSRRAGRWVWKRLPELPWPVSSGGIATVGSKIYLVGGADYDKERFYTNADRNGKQKRLGARLLVIDTKDLKAGWKELAPCPGTPRWIQATAAVDGRLYVIGGGTGNDNPAGHYCTVVDNWRYDPGSDRWQRLGDLPVASGNFPSGRIVYGGRYILLLGGYQYSKILNPDGSLRELYGKPCKHYPQKAYYSDLFVYDTKTGTFGTATPLPLNNNLPMTVLSGDRIHLVGGEIEGAVIEGEPYGHHPDLYLVGTIRRRQE